MSTATGLYSVPSSTVAVELEVGRRAVDRSRGRPGRRRRPGAPAAGSAVPGPRAGPRRPAAAAGARLTPAAVSTISAIASGRVRSEVRRRTRCRRYGRRRRAASRLGARSAAGCARGCASARRAARRWRARGVAGQGVSQQARDTDRTPMHVRAVAGWPVLSKDRSAPLGRSLRDGAQCAAHGVQQYVLLAGRSGARGSRGSAGVLDRQRVAILSWGSRSRPSPLSPWAATLRGPYHGPPGTLQTGSITVQGPNGPTALGQRAGQRGPSRDRRACPARSRGSSSGPPGTGRSSRSWPSG